MKKNESDESVLFLKIETTADITEGCLFVQCMSNFDKEVQKKYCLNRRKNVLCCV